MLSLTEKGVCPDRGAPLRFFIVLIPLFVDLLTQGFAAATIIISETCLPCTPWCKDDYTEQIDYSIHISRCLLCVHRQALTRLKIIKAGRSRKLLLLEYSIG